MTFYFYDLETSSGSSRDGRIMQFAGQRTNEKLETIGEPDNIVIKLTNDILPDPFAILVHGITPQKSIAEGISEADFITYFEDKIAVDDTVFVGYNNIRFDDDFVRYAMYRSLRDPYEWHYKNGRSRWDLLDPIRMMRALRPEGLEWPFASDGKPTVSLEAMTNVNGISHENAHDALADIQALLELARRFKKTQPKLFNYLFAMRDKKAVEALVCSGKPFVYTSGKYSGEFLKTTVAHKLIDHPTRQGAVVYDLRVDPAIIAGLPPTEIARRWRSYEPEDRLPLKTLQYNRCPAVAEISTLKTSAESQERIKIDLKVIESNLRKLLKQQELPDNVKSALEILDKEQQELFGTEGDVDSALFDGFWSEADKKTLASLRAKAPANITKEFPLKNKKIEELAFRFVARNFPQSLTSEEKTKWEEVRIKLIQSERKYGNGLEQFAEKLQKAASAAKSEQQQYLLTELQLYVESILPYDTTESI